MVKSKDVLTKKRTKFLEKMLMKDKNSSIDRLIDLMAKLRDPQTGCPWDREQTFQTIAPHTIEEAYEVADAIGRHSMPELREELGDLLFQVVFYARMAEEEGEFDFYDVVAAISDKMLRRHPHVFGDDVIKSVEQQRQAWEQHKQLERKGRDVSDGGHLDGIARALPSAVRAYKLQQRAAEVGFDWPDVSGVFAKISEELEEVTVELEQGASVERIKDEVGDLLFACVNLARHAGVDAESALRGTNDKFERRFRAVELALAAQGRTLEQSNLEEMEALWTQAKEGHGE
jgi:ATP diphosphatase